MASAPETERTRRYWRERLGATIAAELARFRRRRIRPRVEALRNLARRPEARIALRRIDFAGR